MKSVLDSRQLLAARILANTGSFTLAGQQLSLTQSAVSHAIKALEEELECPLFTRTGRGVRVTVAGEHFLQHADAILAQMETARTVVAPRTTRGKERLRVGVGGRLREFILPVVRPGFQREYGAKLVLIEPGNYSRNLDLLMSGLIDLAFTVRPLKRPEFGYFHLFEDEMRFIVSPEHPWAASGRVSGGDLAGGMPVLIQDYNNAPALLEDHLRTEKLAARHVITIPDYEPIKKIARTGRAVGVMPLWLVAQELAEGTLVALPVGPRPLLRQWGLAYMPKQPLTAMDRRFMELCRQAVPGILSRLQGQPAGAREKKEDAVIAPLVEPYLKCSGVAMLITATYNFLSDSMAWGNFGSILSAAS